MTRDELLDRNAKTPLKSWRQIGIGYVPDAADRLKHEIMYRPVKVMTAEEYEQAKARE